MAQVEKTCSHCSKLFSWKVKDRPQVKFFCSKECQYLHSRSRRSLSCDTCGKHFERKLSHVTENNFCSRACARPFIAKTSQLQPSGDQSHAWKGGVIYKDGYRFLKMPDHPNAKKSGYVAEHRVVMSSFIGRALLKHEVVHHKNEDKLDNRIENLEIMSIGDHGREHRDREVHGWRLYASGCVECGTKEKRHWAHGLCVRCYIRGANRKRRQRLKSECPSLPK